MAFEARKLYYKIGEVCEIVGVEAYVLRYWETEFPALRPPKSKSGQRTYRPSDIELLLRIRRLLYEDGFTIAGARRQLARSRAVEKPSPSSRRVTARGSVARPVPKAPAEPAKETGASSVAEKKLPPTSESLSRVRQELENILTLLERE